MIGRNNIAIFLWHFFQNWLSLSLGSSSLDCTSIVSQFRSTPMPTKEKANIILRANAKFCSTFSNVNLRKINFNSYSKQGTKYLMMQF